VICFSFSRIGSPCADDPASCAAPGIGDDVDATFDLAHTVEAGLAVVLAIVDGFDRLAVKERGHVDEIDAVLDEIRFPLRLVPLEGHC